MMMMVVHSLWSLVLPATHLSIGAFIAILDLYIVARRVVVVVGWLFLHTVSRTIVVLIVSVTVVTVVLLLLILMVNVVVDNVLMFSIVNVLEVIQVRITSISLGLNRAYHSNQRYFQHLKL